MCDFILQNEKEQAKTLGTGQYKSKVVLKENHYYFHRN